jgi:hypothetical protein
MPTPHRLARLHHPRNKDDTMSEERLDALLPAPLVCAISIAGPSSPSSTGTSSTMALSTSIYAPSSTPRVRACIGLISRSRVCRAMPIPEHTPIINRASGYRCIAPSGRSAAAIGPTCHFLTRMPMLVCIGGSHATDFCHAFPGGGL